MVQQLPAGYVFDPEDPRAPAEEEWSQMSPEERARVVAMLPPHERLVDKLRRQIAESDRLREEEQLRREESDRLRDEAEKQLAEARAEIERLKKAPA